MHHKSVFSTNEKAYIWNHLPWNLCMDTQIAFIIRSALSKVRSQWAELTVIAQSCLGTVPMAHWCQCLGYNGIQGLSSQCHDVTVLPIAWVIPIVSMENPDPGKPMENHENLSMDKYPDITTLVWNLPNVQKSHPPHPTPVLVAAGANEALDTPMKDTTFFQSIRNPSKHWEML